MMRFNKGLLGLALGALVLALAACGGGASSSSGSSGNIGSSDGTASQVATSQITTVANSEDTSSGVAYFVPKQSPSWIARLWRSANWEPTALAAGGYNCSPNMATYTDINATEETYQPPTPCVVTYPNGVSKSMTWSGYWLLTYTGGASCPTLPAHGVFGATSTACSLTRLTNSSQNSVSAGTVSRTVVDDNSRTVIVTYDTNTSSGYSNSIQGPVTVSCVSGNGCPQVASNPTGERSISIGGTHLTSTLDGVTQWDHTINTSTNLLVTGSGSDRSIVGGTVVIQHNLAHFISTTTVTTALAYSGTCLFPISGELTTTFSGTRYSGTETITFGPACGDATITFTDGTQSSVTMVN